MVPKDSAVLPAILAPQQPAEALWDFPKRAGEKDVFQVTSKMQ